MRPITGCFSVFVSGVLARKARRDLLALGVQGVSVSLLVGCGVALLVASWSSYESLKRARDSFYSSHSFADWFVDLKRAPRDALARIRRLPQVDRVEDRIVLFGRITRGRAVAMGRLISLPDQGQPVLNRIHIRKGRLPEASRGSADRVEVLVHEAFAIAHRLQPGDELRAVVEGRERRLTVVGIGISPESVYALSPRSPFPDDRRYGIFWIPRKVMEGWGDLESSFNSLVITQAHSQAGGSEAVLPRRLRQVLAPYGARFVQPRSRQISNVFVEDEIRQQRVSAFFYPMIFFGVAAWLLHVVATRWVEVQRPQVAALKSLGYSDLALTVHLLWIMIWIVATGISTGIAGGIGLGRLFFSSYQNFFRFPEASFQLSHLGLLLGIVMGVLPGLLGCTRSLARIFRLTPVEAMRPLSPIDFSRVPRFVRGGIRTRIVGRNLLRRPSRLVLSVAGISVGISIMVLSGAWQDILDELVGRQFWRREREDVGLFLVHPRPLASLSRFKGIPGVHSAQGQRIAPALIRFRQVEREVALVGVPDGPPQKTRHRTWRAPLHGIELPGPLARVLGAGPGDRLELTLLEGRGASWKEAVVGVSNDPVGMLVPIPASRLAKRLDEPELANLVTLEADSSRWQEIQEKLDEFPEVAGAGLKRERLASFHRTVGKIVKISTRVLGVFSLLIATGVVFNLVRVSFSERSWEMASLRVLGLSDRGVFAILGSETAIQVALAVVPGSALGWFWIFWSSKWIHSEAMEFPVIVDPSTYGLAGVVAALALSLSLASCWWRLLGLSPVTALKARE